VLDLIFFIIIFLLLAICVLVGVAFIVHLERRVLGYVHIHKSPNRVGFIGLFQPFSDAIKLFTREQYFPLVFKPNNRQNAENKEEKCTQKILYI
jgi:NADH-ubiquinone oxidoreductase chain 1